MEQRYSSVCRVLAFGGELQYNGLCFGIMVYLAMEVCHKQDIEGCRPRTPGRLVVIVQVPVVS